jgi:GNAT superfamily N-acetyltransferase
VVKEETWLTNNERGLGPSLFHVKHTSQIRAVRAEDAQRIGAIARDAYAKYARIGREPAPMTENFAAAISHGTVVVIEGGALSGFLIGWPEPGAYFVESGPAAQGKGLGRRLIDCAADQARTLGSGRSGSTVTSP